MEMEIWLNTSWLLEHTIPTTTTAPSLKSPILTHNPQANPPSTDQSALCESHTEDEVKQAQSAQMAYSFVEVTYTSNIV